VLLSSGRCHHARRYAGAAELYRSPGRFTLLYDEGTPEHPHPAGEMQLTRVARWYINHDRLSGREFLANTERGEHDFSCTVLRIRTREGKLRRLVSRNPDTRRRKTLAADANRNRLFRNRYASYRAMRRIHPEHAGYSRHHPVPWN
jgi:hypothetical protein